MAKQEMTKAEKLHTMKHSSDPYARLAAAAIEQQLVCDVNMGIQRATDTALMVMRMVAAGYFQEVEDIARGLLAEVERLVDGIAAVNASDDKS